MILCTSIFPIHTGNHTSQLKSSNNFSFWTLNSSEQFSTEYKWVSRAKKGKYSKMQNILERNCIFLEWLDGTLFKIFLCWLFFLSKFTCNLLLIFSILELKRIWIWEESHKVWFENSEIPSNLYLNVLQANTSTVISRNTQTPSKKKTLKSPSQQTQAF